MYFIFYIKENREDSRTNSNSSKNANTECFSINTTTLELKSIKGFCRGSLNPGVNHENILACNKQGFINFYIVSPKSYKVIL